MRDRKKRNIIIGSLCCLLVFMGIGYAILSQTLNISGIANMRGNWNVKITNMELLSENKTGRAEEVSHSFTDTTATFTADLYMPGDSIEYRVTVENQGNIDALLKSITPTTTNRSEGIKFSHSEIDNTVLTAGKTITFTMKVEFLESATSIPNVENVKYNLELVYVQYNGGEYTPAVETTEEDCFWISDDGTLLSYDKSCGTDNVVIPAKINNIPVKRVAAYALMFAGASSNSSAQTSTGESIYIFKNEEAKTKYIENMRKEGSTDEEINEIMKTSYIYGSTELNALKLKTKKDYIIEEGEKYKVTKDSTGHIKFEIATSSDYNIIYYQDFDPAYSRVNSLCYCVTNADCELLKEYYRSKDPARNYGVTDSSYYEYLYNSAFSNDDVGVPASTLDFLMLDTQDYIKYQMGGELANESIITLDYSNAIYMEDLNILSLNVGSNIPKKLVLPPNIKNLMLPTAEQIVFPKNSKTEVIVGYTDDGDNTIIKPIDFPSTLKVIGNGLFTKTKVESITIPQSVVRIGHDAFNNSELTSLSFETKSSLVALYGTHDTSTGSERGSFANNKLTTLKIPKTVQYIGNDTFNYNNLKSVVFETDSKLKYVGSNAFRNNQLTNTGLGKLPSSLTNLATDAFINNPDLTQITLTSPTDLEGWPNGEMVGDITVVYER